MGGGEAGPGDAGGVPRSGGEAAPGGVIAGAVAAAVLQEFRGLRLAWTCVDLPARGGRPALTRRSSPPSLRRRLAELSTRYRGATAVSMRTHAVPRAYRTFFRQIGLDPDVQRIPAERAALQRLLHGGFVSTGLVADACLAALIETGVGVWALDAAAVDGAGLGIRTASGQEGAGGGAAAGTETPPLPAGSLVVADAARIHAVLFEEPAPGSAATAASRGVALYAIAVDGVPEVHLEEALWTARDLLEGHE